MNYEDILHSAKNIMQRSIDFLKDKNYENMTIYEMKEFYKVFYIDFKNLINFLSNNSFFSDVVFKNFSEQDISIGDKNSFYMGHLKKYIYECDKWGLNKCEKLLQEKLKDK